MTSFRQDTCYPQVQQVQLIAEPATQTHALRIGRSIGTISGFAPTIPDVVRCNPEICGPLRGMYPLPATIFQAPYLGRFWLKHALIP